MEYKWSLIKEVFCGLTAIEKIIKGVSSYRYVDIILFWILSLGYRILTLRIESQSTKMCYEDV